MSIAVRFYINRFFISSGLGWSFLNYTVQNTNTSEENADKMDYLYQSFGLGYQLKLNERNSLEPFLYGSTGGLPRANGTSKITAGVRYTFRFQ